MATIAQRDRVIELLKARGVEIEIGGCGCCGSPFVKVVVDGEIIVDDEHVNIPVHQYERDQEAKRQEAQNKNTEQT
jgi:hypothetical protein